MPIFERTANFFTHALTIYTVIAGMFSAIIAGYVGYKDFIKAIEENQKQIELTQIMILKPLVRQAENNPCYVSDAEWDEYLMNGSTLQVLKQKHGLVAKTLAFRPINRIRKDKEDESCKDQ